MSYIIEMNRVTKTFKEKQALKAISLKITNKKMTALLGPSGSGKSTLLRHLGGLLIADKKTESEIKVLGKTVQKGGRLSRDICKLRASSGYIFQQFNLVKRMSVLTNVLVGALSQTPKWRTLTGMFTAEQ